MYNIRNINIYLTGVMELSISKYEAFVKVVELGSLSKAAEALGYTQSGISHMISSLESELGFSILLRSRAGVLLTDGGERILPVLRSILNSRNQLDQIVASIRGLDAGTVRIGTFTSVAVHWLPEIIKGFQELYPRIEFKLLNGDYYDVEQWLREGSIDIGFVRTPFNYDCYCVPLVEDRLLAILPSEHRLSALERFPISSVLREPFISLPESSAQDAMGVLDAAGVKPNIRFTTKDDYAILAMVRHGLGISIVPELLLTGNREDLAIKELDPPSSRTISLAIRSPESSGPATLKFVEHVRQWVQNRYPEQRESSASNDLSP